MTDVASLGLAVDSSQVTAATGALNQFAAASTNAAKRADGLTNSASRTETQTRVIQTMADRTGVSFKEMEARIRATTSAFDAYGSRSRAVEQANIAAAKAANDNTAAIAGAGRAAENTNSSFDRFANTITRRLIAAFVIKEIKDFTQYLWGLAAAVAATGNAAELAAVSYQKFQGLQTSAAYKGISNEAFNSAMVEFNREVDEAKRGVGDLKSLLSINGQTVSDTAATFGKVADLVAKARTEAQKFQILQEAHLPASAAFVKYMEQGGAAIKAQGDSASKLTDQQIADAKRVNDAWNRMWTDFETSGKKAAVNVVSAISEIWNRGFGPNTNQNVGNNLLRAGAGTSLNASSDVSGFYKGIGTFDSSAGSATKTRDEMLKTIAVEQAMLNRLTRTKSIEELIEEARKAANSNEGNRNVGAQCRPLAAA
jgi:hypothetical protein